MNLLLLQKDLEILQETLAKGNLDEAETMLDLILMDVKAAQPSAQPTAENCTKENRVEKE